jgi:hypothetical protein
MRGVEVYIVYILYTIKYKYVIHVYYVHCVREERLPFAVHASGWLRSETRQKERVCRGPGRLFFSLQLYSCGINRYTRKRKNNVRNCAAVNDFGQ